MKQCQECLKYYNNYEDHLFIAGNGMCVDCYEDRNTPNMPIIKTKAIKLPVPTEDVECMLLAQYLRLKKLRFSHIAQETPAGSYQYGVWKPNFKTLKRNKAVGVEKGVPDYIIILPGKKFDSGISKLLFIEMKRERAGKISPEQEDWIADLTKIGNVYARVCYGFEDAKKYIDTLC